MQTVAIVHGADYQHWHLFCMACDESWEETTHELWNVCAGN